MAHFSRACCLWGAGRGDYRCRRTAWAILRCFSERTEFSRVQLPGMENLDTAMFMAGSRSSGSSPRGWVLCL